MKAFILAAGLGTRLRPFTLENPKALVPVGGVPMLQRVILRLKEEGFDDIVINVHHFADKIEDFVKSHDGFGVRIRFSDERSLLLDTGGGLLHAAEMLTETPDPFMIHNVDILSNASLAGLMAEHREHGNDATLLVSDRDSSRRLIFDNEMSLRGWHNLKSGEYKPQGYHPGEDCRELAFSGIHVMSPDSVFEAMRRFAGLRGNGTSCSDSCQEVFSVIDFYLDAVGAGSLNIGGVESRGLKLIDIGKPATLSQANELFAEA